MKGKLIVIEGTDCSGKETQANILIEKLRHENIKCVKLQFPRYDTPTGRIVGGPYLGKSYICDGWFPEMATAVDPKVASLYFAADRLYNIKEVENLIDNGTNVILDRYTYSNMAHQGGKLNSKKDRINMYRWLENLEFDLLQLPRCDVKLFLHMPISASKILKQSREESLDQLEQDDDYLKQAELSYLEVAQIYDFFTIECELNNKIRTIEEISQDVFEYVYHKIIE